MISPKIRHPVFTFMCPNSRVPAHLLSFLIRHNGTQKTGQITEPTPATASPQIHRYHKPLHITTQTQTPSHRTLLSLRTNPKIQSKLKPKPFIFVDNAQKNKHHRGPNEVPTKPTSKLPPKTKSSFSTQIRSLKPQIYEFFFPLPTAMAGDDRQNGY